MGELIRAADAARLAVGDMSRQVAEEEYMTVPLVDEQPNVDKEMPTFEGLQNLNDSFLSIVENITVFYP